VHAAAAKALPFDRPGVCRHAGRSGQELFRAVRSASTFDLDVTDLAARYRELQRHFHPDRFASASEPERRLSLQLTAQVNAAFQTLKDPVARARYLLALQGVDTGEDTDTAMDTAFLMEQMELRESLAEARDAPDRNTRLESLRQRVEDDFETRSVLLRARFTENSEPALRQARNLVREMQFLQKLAHEVEELE
jgi:molecular chaperone HscB